MRVSDGVSKENERAALLRVDNVLSLLKSKTPAEVNQYVQNNVNSLGDVKDLLVKLLLMVRTL